VVAGFDFGLGTDIPFDTVGTDIAADFGFGTDIPLSL